jgi:hypothetical protein
VSPESGDSRESGGSGGAHQRLGNVKKVCLFFRVQGERFVQYLHIYYCADCLVTKH